ncbi:hypothetical protein [Rhabdaerophilum calidifontis]|uniref:hypothetical protein n=1 Tax=Rhabdaerophilum calidifontis TaxID=2604328 RepID=UPI00123BD35B|nr:hypothetical protein [Rhabdaerophilum calidifontis]
MQRDRHDREGGIGDCLAEPGIGEKAIRLRRGPASAGIDAEALQLLAIDDQADAAQTILGEDFSGARDGARAALGLRFRQPVPDIGAGDHAAPCGLHRLGEDRPAWPEPGCHREQKSQNPPHPGRAIVSGKTHLNLLPCPLAGPIRLIVVLRT